jgi:cardiolipin synthase
MKTLPHYYEYTLRAEGIKAYRFGKVSPRISSVHNNRDHRKICVIDGRVGYTGGVNIADEYVNERSRFGHWKDGGIRLSGDAVRGLIKGFLSSWDYTARSISDYERFISSVATADDADGGFYIPFGSGPTPIYRRPVGKNVFLNIINQSRKFIYITTPYLVIDYELTESLCNAAKRGVDVRIITPGIPDKKKIKVMTKSSYPHLLDSGVKIYEYTPGFIHEKTFIADDKYGVIGTINLDYRSLVHHFENAVWMYRTPSVKAAAEAFRETLKVCEEIDGQKAKLHFSEWVVRNAIKFFTPLM